MFCPRCNSPLEQGARFCDGCGSEIAWPAAPQQVAPQAPAVIGEDVVRAWAVAEKNRVEGTVMVISLSYGGVYAFFLLAVLGGIYLLLYDTPLVFPALIIVFLVVATLGIGGSFVLDTVSETISRHKVLKKYIEGTTDLQRLRGAIRTLDDEVQRWVAASASPL